MKKQIDYLSASSLRGLLQVINECNASSDTPILKEDIVQIMHEGETFILIYYK